MKIVAPVALLHLCLLATVSGDASTETFITAAPGDVVLLPCYTDGNVTPSLTTWMKNGREVIRGGGEGGEGASAGSSPGGERLDVLHDGSLNIRGVMRGDEGSYLCSSTLSSNITFQALVHLQVTIVSTSISPATALSNRTLYVVRGSSVSLNCSASPYPSQQLTWAFAGASSRNDSLVSSSGPWLDFRIEDIQPSQQGLYSCTAQNNVSQGAVSKSTELLVYYIPDVHPECMWAPTPDPAHAQFNCSWFGAYPTPELHWGEDVFVVTDSLSVTLNRSLLSDGETVKCAARHPLLDSGQDKSCSFVLKRPFPEGEPMVAALEASKVTLTCTETTSTPPANTTWRKGLQQDAIEPGSKYVISEEGPVLKLTILNISKEDEGYYFCRSENPLAVLELEVFLTVKTASSAYTGAIIGVFIAALIVGSAVVIAKVLYSSRHRICLGGGGFGQIEDRGDVLSLVDSDDEQFFQDTVPQLPPVTNGHQTTLVQIHRIPPDMSDHEDAEAAETSPQQQEDTAQTEEPEDILTF